MHYNDRQTNNIRYICYTNTQAVNSSRIQLSNYKGIIIMLLLILLLGLSYNSFHPIPNSSGLFVVVVIYCIYKEGIRNGIIAAILAFLYTSFYYSRLYELLPYPGLALLGIFVNVLALVGAILIVAFQKIQIKSYSTRLEKSEKKFSSLFQNTNDCIFLYRLSNKELPAEYVEVNNTACNRLGYSKEEFFKLSPLDINSDGNHQHFLNVSNMLVSKGHCTVETTHITKSGKRIPVEVSSHIINMDNEKMVLAIARDLSERKEAFNKLLESEERYRQLVEYSPDAIAVHHKGKIIYANSAAAKLVRLSAPELLIGKSIQEYMYPATLESISSEINEVESGHTEATDLITQKIIASDGSLIDVQIINIAFPFKGAIAVQIIIRDISDKKKAEKLEENIEEKKKLLEDALRVDQFKTELFSNIAHELRTPINVIFATLQLMEFFLNNQYQNDDTTTINKYLHITKQNSFRLLRLVNNSIDISKIDSGYFELNLKNHDIVSLVEDITLSVAEYIEHKSIELLFDTNIEELVIACDPDKIERIILNLLSNAAKFTPKGGTILVNVRNQRNKVVFSVKDTGIGIPKEKLNSVFQRYQQVNTSLIKNHNGSGIGLSLVKSLVEMHHGKISVESEVNKGSEFTIELPSKKLSEGELTESFTDINEGRIERISIEFSDIYA